MNKNDANKIIDNTEDKMNISKEIWLKSERLNEEEYSITWSGATECQFSSSLLDEKRKGIFITKGCKVKVFETNSKFESGTGWPSFFKPYDEKNIILKEDTSFGMKRVEVLSKYGEHLGHLFTDGPTDKGGKRFCINGKILKFVANEE